MLITHVTLEGAVPVTADATRDLENGQDIVRLFLGPSLTLTLSPQIADAIGDALADAYTALQVSR